MQCKGLAIKGGLCRRCAKKKGIKVPPGRYSSERPLSTIRS